MFFYDQRILHHVCHLNVSTINSRYQRLDSHHPSPSQVCSVISVQWNDVGDVEKAMFVSKCKGYPLQKQNYQLIIEHVLKSSAVDTGGCFSKCNYRMPRIPDTQGFENRCFNLHNLTFHMGKGFYQGIWVYHLRLPGKKQRVPQDYRHKLKSGIGVRCTPDIKSHV